VSAIRVAVVGAGMSGLSAAYRLRARFAHAGQALDLTVLEAQPDAGGHARTIRESGFLVETGPNGFLDRAHEPWMRELARDLGIESSLVEAKPESRRRFILHGGRLRRAPDSPPTLVTTDVLSPMGKLRLLLEPFARPGRSGTDETVFEFASRRVGREAAERLVDAAVSGISAGDSRRLSVRDAFPLMTEMERDHGSLIRAMIARRRLPPPRLMTFRGGMAELVATLGRALKGELRTGCRLAALERSGDAWRLRFEGGGSAEADLVVLAQHAWEAAPLLAPHDPLLGRTLAEQPRAGLALVGLAYPARALSRRLDGYGYLVGRDDGLETLGVVWESSLFAERAPDGMVLLRVMVGGTRHPGAVHRPPDELREIAQRELAGVLGVRAHPAHSWIRPIPDAIAQYTVGHAERVRLVRDRASRLPGIELTGTSYDGVSIGSAVHSGALVAERVLARLPVLSNLIREGVSK
jgi:oxygen-dependent protoporphyrinogen oxidase